MLMADISWANFNTNVLNHNNAQNVCLFMNGGLMDTMQVLVFTIDIGDKKKNIKRFEWP